MKVLPDSPLLDVAEVTEIELLILRRMREYTTGEHAGIFKGSGFDFVGLRDWAAGDRPSTIEWVQSTFNNFAPLVVREFEQHSTATVMAVADRSASTRCGIGGTSLAAGIARAIATVGFSAVFFQDTFGLMTYDEDFQHLAAVRPRIGKSHVLHCLDAYQHGIVGSELKRHEDLSLTIGGHLRTACMIPVISDFLFPEARHVLQGLSHLNTSHDVFLVVVDGSFAFDLPASPSGWVDAYDVETGQSKVISRGELQHLAQRVRAWQEDIERWGKEEGLDVVRLGSSPEANLTALLEFVVARRLRKA